MPRWFTRLLIAILLLCGLWTGWQWLRPYELGQEGAWQVNEVGVRRDHSHAWMEIELRHTELPQIDEPPLTRLINDDGTTLEPADARISSDRTTCQIRYWLELDDLSNAWKLRIPTSELRIKAAGNVSLENNQRRTFRQPHW